MLDYFWTKLKRDNDVAPEAEHSPYINIKGLEKNIAVPEPTRDDRKWARKLKNATSGDVATALISAIETGQNWRVWYLINRPLRKTSSLLLGKAKDLGFDGEARLAEGLAKAAETDNVTAAYLLLKFAEKRTTADGMGDVVRDVMENCTRSNLIDSAEKPGSGVFTLIAQTFAELSGKHSVLHKAEQQMMLAQAAIHAAANGHQAHLDAILDNNLLQPQQFVEAYMHSFHYGRVFGGAKDIDAEDRKPFLEWLKHRGIVDDVFEEEAATVEVRVAAQKECYRDMLAKGWKQSERWMPSEEGAATPPTLEQVEVCVKDKDGLPLTYIFNFTAERACKIKGDLTQVLSLNEVSDPALVGEGRAFVDSSSRGTPELVWKKGEPFRLRMKPQGLE